MSGLNRFCVVTLLLALCAGGIRAQFRVRTDEEEAPPNSLVADFLFTTQSTQIQPQSRISFGELNATTNLDTRPKNGLLAAGLSLVIPGLGEYYVGDQIWRGAIFTVIEGGLWYGRYRYNKQGDASASSFQAWGDSLWIPSHYAKYLDSLMSIEGRPSLITDQSNFSQINSESDTLNALGFPGLAHKLPERGSDQFYQVLAEYVQFSPGWADNLNKAGATSADFQRFVDLSATSSHQYEIANDFLYGVIINHILSAIDAALSAKDHNSAIHLHGELHQISYPDGTLGYQPTAAIEVKF